MEGVVRAVRKASYASIFKIVHGPAAPKDVAKAYDLVAQAIAAFETTRPFNAFTSKYDYYLKGKVALSPRESAGFEWFTRADKGNCVACHPSDRAPDGTPPLFTTSRTTTWGCRRTRRSRR